MTPPAAKARLTVAASDSAGASGSGVTMGSRGSPLADLHPFGVEGKFQAERLDVLLYRGQRALVIHVRQCTDDELADLIHRGFTHAARGDRRRADADAAGDHGRILVEWNRVLVDGDARLAERRLRDLPGEAAREHVHQHEVVVGAAADQTEAAGGEPRRKAAG